MVAIKNTQQITRLLERESDEMVKRKLAFLDMVANRGEEIIRATLNMQIGYSTGYKWIRDWNTRGYAGLVPARKDRVGRPPKLSAKELEQLKVMLDKRSDWTVEEVRRLIAREFGVELSNSQVWRILRKKIGMTLPRSYRTYVS